MVVYELQSNRFEAEATANMLAGDWTILDKGKTKILVEDADVDRLIKQIAEEADKSIDDEEDFEGLADRIGW